MFLLAAVDERVAVAAPVNMISLHMQGGCLCENQPGLRLDTNNVEIAATIAPRPLLMVSATGDWTTNTMQREYPAVRALYALRGAADRVHGVQFDAPHNYNRESREAVYAWMARWLQNEPADVRREERPFTPSPLSDLLVFHQRRRAGQQCDRRAVDRELDRGGPAPACIDTARDAGSGAATLPSATACPTEVNPPLLQAGRRRTVIAAGLDASLETQLRSAGFVVKAIDFTPFDAEEAAKIPHFDTYNRTAASQRVADIVDALRASPDAALVASGDARVRRAAGCRGRAGTSSDARRGRT